MKVFINIFVCLLFVNSIFTLDVYITPEESSKLLGEFVCLLLLLLFTSISCL